MKVCKTKLIPCPAILTEWSELPCMWSQEQCDTWQKRVPTLPFQDKDGNLFKADLCEISRKAKELFDAGYHVPDRLREQIDSVKATHFRQSAREFFSGFCLW